MNELKAVIFDLDGVLVDSHYLHYKSWQWLADQLELDFDEEKGDAFRGMARPECLRVMYEEFNNRPAPDEKTILELTDRKNNYYNKILGESKPEDLILPGAVELLKNLKKENIKIIIASGSRNANTVIDQAQIREYLDSVIDRKDVKNTKPDPEIFQLALKKADTPAGNAVAVEDAILGIQAIKAAGMKAVGVGPYIDKADLIVPSVKELTVEKMRKLLN